MSGKIHFRIKGFGYLCRVEQRWMSCDITSTTKGKNVTCKNCLRIARSYEVNS